MQHCSISIQQTPLGLPNERTLNVLVDLCQAGASPRPSVSKKVLRWMHSRPPCVKGAVKSAPKADLTGGLFGKMLRIFRNYMRLGNFYVQPLRQPIRLTPPLTQGRLWCSAKRYPFRQPKAVASPRLTQSQQKPIKTISTNPNNSNQSDCKFLTDVL